MAPTTKPACDDAARGGLVMMRAVGGAAALGG